jgi:hypothetical protein
VALHAHGVVRELALLVGALLFSLGLAFCAWAILDHFFG